MQNPNKTLSNHFQQYNKTKYIKIKLDLLYEYKVGLIFLKSSVTDTINRK